LNWKFKAQLHLIAAEKIFEAYDAADKRELKKFLEVPFGNHESHAMEGEELNDFLDAQLLPICLLLEGFAVENLLKGIIYSQEQNRLLEDDKNLKLTEDLTHHRLCDLYKDAKLAKSIDEIDSETKEILKVLEQFISWRGRYPVPINLQQLKNSKQIPDTLKNTKKVIELCTKLFQILNDIPNPPTHLSERKSEKEEAG
jgi:hypothetical protein